MNYNTEIFNEDYLSVEGSFELDSNSYREIPDDLGGQDSRFIKFSEFWPGDYFSISTEHY